MSTFFKVRLSKPKYYLTIQSSFYLKGNSRRHCRIPAETNVRRHTWSAVTREIERGHEKWGAVTREMGRGHTRNGAQSHEKWSAVTREMERGHTRNGARSHEKWGAVIREMERARQPIRSYVIKNVCCLSDPRIEQTFK